MNILHLVPALEYGGVETGTIDLAVSLKKLGHQVLVVSSGGPQVETLKRNGVNHIELPVHRKSPYTLFVVPKLARLITSQKIDIVHASSRVPAWAGFLATRITKTPFVTSCHGYYSRHIFSNVMGRGKLVMVISKSISGRMKNDFHVPENKIRLVYRGLDLSKYRYDAAKYKDEKKPFVVMNIGRLTPIKGHYEFIEAMRRVCDHLEAEAWIAGGAPEGKEKYLDTLKDLTKKLHLEKHVKFLGYQSDVPKLLENADCLVLSSNIPEGFGRTIIEAGATGACVCASRIGGIPEIVEDGVSGLLFTPNESSEIANAIVRILKDKELAKKCARNLRKKVEEN